MQKLRARQAGGRHRWMLCIPLAASLWCGSSALAESTHEAYELVQPSVQDVAAADMAATPEEKRFWRHVYRASMEYVAMLFEVEAGKDLYFKVRNMEAPLMVAQLSARDAAERARLHMVNISTSGTLQDPRLGQYLQQRGVSNEAIAAGRKVVYVDATYATGNTHRGFLGHLDETSRKQVGNHSISSYAVGVASCRVAGIQLFAEEERATRLEDRMPVLGGIAHQWEFGAIPQFCGNSDRYEPAGDGTLLAMARIDRQVRTADRPVANIQAVKQDAIRFVQTLKMHATDPDNMRRFERRRKLWHQTASLLKAADWQGLGDLVEHRLGKAASPRQHFFAEAFAQDVAELVLMHPRSESVRPALTPLIRGAARGPLIGPAAAKALRPR